MQAATRPKPTHDRVVNGVDTQALAETIEAINADPRKASCKFFATTRWRSGTVADTTISRYELGGEQIAEDFTITTDEPTALLGTDSAPNPQMVLYAALNSCVLNTFVVNAAARGIPIDRLELELEGELDLHGFLGMDDSINAGYRELTLTCKVSGAGTKAEYEDCLAAGTKYSPNFQTISRPVNINYRIVMA